MPPLPLFFLVEVGSGGCQLCTRKSLESFTSADAIIVLAFFDVAVSLQKKIII